ncbi:MAG: YdcF family protein [Lamprobacter sp.]|uniref:YdcF family protein n=1 Tax=Lamprobacter sp. TaxID=3100796 RepID=UPI002B25B103|nr:YdcF family protein [Lamprobacter sp.]MEA3643447.1 YdcF family protein [Lamprobacter sp.]
MRGFLLDLGVPDRAIRLEGLSTKTVSNASATAALLQADGIEACMLVTSALHMSRARARFERAGLRVVPAPTDFEVIEMPMNLLRYVPDAAALRDSGRAFKELLGRWVGR